MSYNRIGSKQRLGKQSPKKTFPEGQFYVRSKLNPELFLDAKGEGKSKGTPVIVWTFNGQLNQQWEFKKDHSHKESETSEEIEYGTVKCMMSGLYFDLKAAKGPDVICNSRDDSAAGQYFWWDGDHLISKCTADFMNIHNASFRKGAKVVVTKKDAYPSLASTQWELIPVGNIPEDAKPKKKKLLGIFIIG